MPQYRFPPLSPTSSHPDDTPLQSPLTRSPGSPMGVFSQRKSGLKINAKRHSTRGSILLSPGSPVPHSDLVAQQLLDNSKQFVKTLLSNIDRTRREDSIKALRSIKRTLPRLKHSIESIQAESAAAAGTLPPATDLENLNADISIFEDKIASISNNLRRGLDRLQDLRNKIEEKVRGEELSREALRLSLIAYTRELEETIAEMRSKIDSLDAEKNDLQRQLREAKEHIQRLDSLVLRTMKREEMTTRKFRNKIQDTLLDQERLEQRLLDLFETSDHVTREEFLACLHDNKEIRRRILKRRDKLESHHGSDSDSQEETRESVFRGKNYSDLAISEKEFDATLQKARKEIISTLNLDMHSQSFAALVNDEFSDAMTLDDERLELLITQQHDLSGGVSEELAQTPTLHESQQTKNAQVEERFKELHEREQVSSVIANPIVERHKRGFTAPNGSVHGRLRSNSMSDALLPQWEEQLAERESQEREAILFQQKQIFKRFRKIRQEFGEIDEDVAKLYKKLGIKEEDILPENEEAVQTDSYEMSEVSVQCESESFLSPLDINTTTEEDRSSSSSKRDPPPSFPSSRSNAALTAITDRSASFSFNQMQQEEDQVKLSPAPTQTHHQSIQTNSEMLLQMILDALNADPSLAHELLRHLHRSDSDQSIASLRASPKKRASTLPPIRKYTSSNVSDSHESTESLVQKQYDTSASSSRISGESTNSRVLRNGNATHPKKPIVRDFSNPGKARVMMERINDARRAYNDDLKWNQRVKYRVREDLLKTVIHDSKKNRNHRNPAGTLSTNAKLISIQDHKNSLITAQELINLRTSLPPANITRNS